MLLLDVHELTLTPEEAAQPIRVRADIFPGDAEDRTVYFSSDDLSIASVDDGGIVTFTGKTGAAHITAQTETGLSDTCTINILNETTEAEP
jgi:uncharacterized protein YjdB